VASLAQYARQVLGLRSGPSALVAHLFWWGPKEVAKEAAQGVWLRGDEHLETLAYTRAQGWKITKGLKKAVASRLNSMNPGPCSSTKRVGVLSLNGMP
jgi:60 kDa SS-A/Ro ribonucleoprotein